MTIRTSFRDATGLIAREAAKAGVALSAAAAQTGAERRQNDRFDVADAGNEGKRGDENCAGGDKQPSRRARAAATESTAHELQGAGRPEQPAHSSAGRLVGIREDDPEHDPHGGGEERSCQADAASGEHGHSHDAQRDPEAREDPNGVPVPHRQQCSAKEFRAPPAGGKRSSMTGRSGGPGGNRRNLLVFFSAWRSGPARRMDSLLAQLARKERHRLQVARVDVEQQPELAKRFNVRRVPTLVLLKGKQAVARLEGRANAAEIEQLVEPHLEESKSDEAQTS